MKRADYMVAGAGAVTVVAGGWAADRLSPAWGWPLWVAVAIAVLGVVLAFATTRRVLFVSPQIALVAMYVMLIHVGAIGFYHSDPANNTRFVLLSSLAVAAFCVPQGWALLRGALPEPQGGVANDLTGGNELVWNVFATVGVLGAMYYLLRGESATGGLPLLHLFHGFASVHSLAESRLEFATGTTGYLYEFYGVILPITAVAFLLRWIATRSRRHRRSAIALLAFSAFTLVAAGYRGPIELFCVLVAIALSYGLGGLRNKAGAVIGAAAALAFVGLSAGIYSNPGAGTTTGEATEARVFQVQALGPQFVSQDFPYPYPYTDGASLLHDLRGALHDHQPGFAEELPGLRGAKSISNPVGSAFDAYVNFGPAGIAMLMLIMGWATVAVHRRVARKATASAIALGAGLSAALAYGALAGIAGVLLQFGVVTVGLMAGIQGLMQIREVSRQRDNSSRQRPNSLRSVPETLELKEGSPTGAS